MHLIFRQGNTDISLEVFEISHFHAVLRNIFEIEKISRNFMFDRILITEFVNKHFLDEIS